MVCRFILLSGIALLVAGACGDGGGEPEPTYTGEPAGRILFSSDRDGNLDVFIVGADGSDPVNLTNDPGSDDQAAVNDAGDTIAFISNRDGSPDLWLMGMDGSGQRSILSDPGVAARPVWSPDGSQIAHFSAAEQNRGTLWVTDVETGATGPLLELQQEEERRVCSGGTPTDWPEASQVMYQGVVPGGRGIAVCRVNPADFSVSVALSKPGFAIFDAAVSPDGTKVAYSSDELGNFDIWVANIDGTNPVRLTIDPAYDAWPIWSLDGQWLAFVSERDRDAEIFLMRPDGSDVRQLTDNDASDHAPFWTD
ncbi:MAG TPA: hypothetical protein VMR52_08460 [Dehalococcoidia bacterium]|nr:hypothetical protein [Dehalococcoidia bacterium]